MPSRLAELAPFIDLTVTVVVQSITRLDARFPLVVTSSRSVDARPRPVFAEVVVVVVTGLTEPGLVGAVVSLPIAVVVVAVSELGSGDAGLDIRVLIAVRFFIDFRVGRDISVAHDVTIIGAVGVTWVIGIGGGIGISASVDVRFGGDVRIGDDLCIDGDVPVPGEITIRWTTICGIAGDTSASPEHDRHTYQRLDER